MNALTWTALVSGLVVAAGIGLVAFGRSRWAGATQTQMAQLEAARLPMPAGRYNVREIEGLPAPGRTKPSALETMSVDSSSRSQTCSPRACSGPSPKRR